MRKTIKVNHDNKYIPLTGKQKEFLKFQTRTHNNLYGVDCAMKLLLDILEK